MGTNDQKGVALCCQMKHWRLLIETGKTIRLHIHYIEQLDCWLECECGNDVCLSFVIHALVCVLRRQAKLQQKHSPAIALDPVWLETVEFYIALKRRSLLVF